ncbi:O-antigen ligase family protein [Candidatus Berkelbacteria bacterium]|nr:O-antigen ligase family protein [Candidatus Berkelbacteria bacterium]
MKKLNQNLLAGSAVVIAALLVIGALTLVELSSLVTLGLVFALSSLVIFAFALINRPKFAVYALVFAIVSGQILRLRLTEEAAGSILFLDIAMGGYVVLGLVAAALNRQPLPRSLSLIFLLAFGLWIPIGLTVNSGLLLPRELLVALAYFVRFGFLALTLFVTAWLAQKKETQIWLLRLLLGGALTLLAIGIAQRIFVPDIRFLTRFGWDPHVNRLLSTFLDPNFFGMFLVMLYALALAGVMSVKGKAQLWLTILATVTALAVVATLSRSSYLAVAIATFVVLFFKSWRLMTVALIGVVMMVSLVPNVRDRVVGAFSVDTTSLARIQSWQETIEIGNTNPLVGVGYNAFGAAKIRLGFLDDLTSQSAQGGDSSLLLVYATTGVIGLLIYLAFWLSIFLESYSLWRTANEPVWQMVGLGIMAIIPAYLVHSNFVNGLFYPHLFIPFALLAGVVIGKANAGRQAKEIFELKNPDQA